MKIKIWRYAIVDTTKYAVISREELEDLDDILYHASNDYDCWSLELSPECRDKDWVLESVSDAVFAARGKVQQWLEER
jgi:hypothetical protein